MNQEKRNIDRMVKKEVHEALDNLISRPEFSCNDQTCMFNGKHFRDPFKCQLKKVVVGFETGNEHWCGMYQKKAVDEQKASKKKQTMMQEREQYPLGRSPYPMKSYLDDKIPCLLEPGQIFMPLDQAVALGYTPDQFEMTEEYPIVCITKITNTTGGKMINIPKTIKAIAASLVMPKGWVEQSLKAEEMIIGICKATGLRFDDIVKFVESNPYSLEDVCNYAFKYGSLPQVKS
jgi:hypothetical protein